MSYYQLVSESEENFIINIEDIEVNKENVKVEANEGMIKVEINHDNSKKDVLNFPLKNKNSIIDLKSVSAKLKDKILTINAKLLKKEEKKKEVEIFDEKEDIVKRKEEEIEELKKAYNELNDKYLRLMADFENSRKFWDKREMELKSYGGVDLIRNLLPVIDAMQLAFRDIEKDKKENMDDENKKHIEGLKMIFENFIKILFDSGLKEIESINKKFDPQFHEAYMVESTDKFPDGTVIEEFQKGYMYKGIVLRTAKVKVSKK